MQKVSNEAILNLLRGNAPEPLTNAEIRNALDCTKDDTPEISARVRGMVKRQACTKVRVTMKGDKLAWFVKV